MNEEDLQEEIAAFRRLAEEFVALGDALNKTIEALIAASPEVRAFMRPP